MLHFLIGKFVVLVYFTHICVKKTLTLLFLLSLFLIHRRL